MGLLQKARDALRTEQEVAAAEHQKWLAKRKKAGEKYIKGVLGVNVVLDPYIDKVERRTFVIDTIEFTINWTHRGYDNLGGGMFWEIYLVGDRYNEIRRLEDVAKYYREPKSA